MNTKQIDSHAKSWGLALVLAVGGVASARAGYDAEGGYVTLGGDEYSNGALLSNRSFTEKGTWSDGFAPHPDTNYYATGIGFYPATFKGKSLTALRMRRNGGNTTWANLESYPVVVNDLRIADGGRIAQFGSSAPILFTGALTVLGTMDFVGGQTSGTSSGWNVIRMSIAGDETSKIVFMADDGKNTSKAGNPQYMSGSYAIGDTTAFKGAIEVWMNQTLILGDYGFANAKSVMLNNAYAGLSSSASAGAVVPIGKLVTTAASKLTLPVSNSWAVTSLQLAANTLIDCSSATADAVANGGIVVSEELTLGGKVRLDLGGIRGLSRSCVRILSVPASVKTLVPSDFELVNYDEDGNLLFDVRTTDGVSEACLVRKNSMPDLPASFGAENGYVLLASADSGSRYSFESAGNWSDAKAPHKGTNYYSNSNYLYGPGTYPTFLGDRLVLNSTLRLACPATVTAFDLWALPNGTKTAKDQLAMMTTSGGSTYNTTISAKTKMTVFATEKYPFGFMGGRFGMKWKFLGKLVGESTSGIYFVCHPTYTTPGVEEYQFGADLFGDCSEYYGTVMIDWNCLFRLGEQGLPHGTLKVVRPESTKITSEMARAVSIPVAALVAPEGAVLEPLEGNVFEFGKVSAAKALVKNGAGILSVGKAVSVADGTVLNVNEGAIRPRSDESFSGFEINFADGSGIVVGLDDAALLKTDRTVTAAGSVMLDVLGVREKQLDEVSVAVAELKSASAQALCNALTIRKVRGFVASKSIEAEDLNGNRKIVVDFRKAGLVITVR